ncbi:MAG: polysaccharide deacetylase family protein, partial [Chitinivibrionia bacterium]|nr:polysaccharide deacetylase family protein [Chitinivibrionia bacterium]
MTLSEAGFLCDSLEATVNANREDGKTLAITFDDAYEELADQLPILINTFGIKPCVFVPTAFIGRRNEWDYTRRLLPAKHLNIGQLRELAATGVEVGSHGHNHV